MFHHHPSTMADSEDISPATIGARMAFIRSVFALSQNEIAAVADVKKANVSHWENGRARPTIAQASKIADRLGLTLDYIFLGRSQTLPYAVAVKLAEAEARNSTR